MRFEFLDENLSVIQCDYKRITGGVFGESDFILTSCPTKDSGIWEVVFIVLHTPSAHPLSQAFTKAEALSNARAALSGAQRGVTLEAIAAATQTQDARRRKAAETALSNSQQVEFLRPRQIKAKRRRVFDAAGGACFYCKAELQIDGDWHVEHRVPLARGGTSLMENLTAACIPCNSKKRTMTDEEFFKAIGMKAA